MPAGFASLICFMMVSAAVVPLMLGAGFLLRPRQRHNRLKDLPYECGEAPVGTSWVQFNIRFYRVAIVFLIFDVEMALLLPTLVLFRKSTMGQLGALTPGILLLEIFLFIGVLLMGLLYCWVHGDLDWVRDLSKEGK